MRILIATDAWRPQINGVVRSLESLAKHLEKLGVKADFLTPLDFLSVPMPGYKEIHLACVTPNAIRRALEKNYEHVHIATEGPIGMVMRNECLRTRRCFTTSFHTLFPEYLNARIGVPLKFSYALLRKFHNSSAGTMVSTSSLARDLNARGFQNLLRWSRGVDHDLFTPEARKSLDFPRPIFLYAGRLALEKNIEAFLTLDLPGSKLVVGDGPAGKHLKHKFPNAYFLGAKAGQELASIYASADVFVFPSRTDTFGMVLLEALSSGLPIAAFPVMGPLDVVGSSGAGILSEDLAHAAFGALEIPRERARAHALTFSWKSCAQQFLDNIKYAQAATKYQETGNNHLSNQELKKIPA